MATAKKSAHKTAKGRPFQKGGDPRQGRGPKPGAPNAGRPRDEFKELCRAMVTREATISRVADILTDPDHPQFMRALQWATEHGYGKADQSLDIQGSVAVPLTIRVVRETKAVRGG
jgi:hypothetical protein